MGIPLSGEPVQWSIAKSAATISSSTVAINIFYPGTSTARVLLSTEMFTFMSLLGGSFTSNTFIVKSPASTNSTNALTANNLLFLVASDGTSWHDDGTGAMSGLEGVIPSVITPIATATAGYPFDTWITGTGFITQSFMGAQRNPQWALLSNNSNANT